VGGWREVIKKEGNTKGGERELLEIGVFSVVSRVFITK
jgi:hypothetical protein